MTQQLSPWLETAYGWAYGENGWNTGMDANLLKFSVMFDRNVDSIVASLPPAVNGQVHYNTSDNRIYFAVNTTYFSTPVPKWFIVSVRNTGDTWQYNGLTLSQVENITNLDSRLNAVELTLTSLGTAAFEDISSFATAAELDVSAAQAGEYTDALRVDVADTTLTTKGSGQVGYNSTLTYPVNTVGGEIKSLSTSVTTLTSDVANFSSSSDPGGLRIAFHYNIENSPEKLERLKALGFNTVWVYRGAPWMGDIARSLAFLDLIQRHGVFAIFQPQVLYIANGAIDQSTTTFINEKAWMVGIDSHPALLGWASFDEPVGQGVSVQDQYNFLSQVRLFSNKSIFMAESANTLLELDSFYSSLGYDVFLIDIYLGGQGFAAEGDFKAEHVRRIFNFLSYDGGADPTQKRKPRQIIPILPTFSGEGFVEPTAQETRWAIDSWRPFTSSAEYAVFAHDVTSPGFTTLDTSQDLRDLCSVIAAQWAHGEDGSYVLITPSGHTLSSGFLGSSNITATTTATGQSHGIFSPTGAGNYSVSGKLQVTPGARHAVLYTKTFNSNDAASRNVTLSVSVDGTNWVDVKTVVMGSANAGLDTVFAYELPKGQVALGFRVTITALAGSDNTGYTGILALGAVSV